MTGKQFKEFAQLVPDSAVIETRSDQYPNEWNPLNPAAIQARLIVTPEVAAKALEQETATV